MPPPNSAVPDPLAPDHCQACGASLPQPDAVCPVCEPALAQAVQDEHRLALPPHRCPACGQHFALPGVQGHPEGAPWYLPAELKGPACPHCHVALSDRRQRVVPPGWLVAHTLAGLALIWWLPPVWALLYAGAVQFWWLRRRATVPDEQRYEAQRMGGSPRSP